MIREERVGMPRRRWLWRGRSSAVLAAACVTLAGVGAGPAFANSAFTPPYLGGVSGPQPAKSVDLAGTWDFQTVQTTTCTPAAVPVGPQPCVNAPSAEHTTIQVPGGGWVKQGFTDVSEAIYSRVIEVPDIRSPQATKLVFGAVNHRATLTIQSVHGGPVQTVGTNTTSWTPSSFDLTPFVRPGGRYRISVDVKGRYALRDAGGYFTVPEGASWSPNIAQGIFQSARLQIFPALSITDAFVRTSVETHSLQYDVTISNGTDRPQTAKLDGRLSSWNRRPWRYPTLRDRWVTVPAHATQTFTSPAVAWNLGPESYWWPNLPYRPGYRAQLHDLELELHGAHGHTHSSRSHDDDVKPSGALVRFGFRESRQVGPDYELNGVRINYRGDSFQPADYDSIDNGGRGDAIDTLPRLLKPTPAHSGRPR